MSFRLKVNTHLDCIIIQNAVREHCRKMEDEYHYAALAAISKGEEKRASELFSQRNAQSLCAGRTLERLKRMQVRFESLMELEEDTRFGGGDYNACPGDVAARDSF